MKIQDLKAISYKILKSAQISSLPVDSHKLLSYYDVIPENFSRCLKIISKDPNSRQKNNIARSKRQ